MRLHHAEKTAGTLPIDTPEREHARAVIVTEIDRLHWRIWNGKAKDAQITLERIRQVMPVFQGDRRPEEGSVVTPVVDGAARDRPLSDQPERLAGQLCRTPSRRSAGRHVDHGRHRQLPGQPPHEQIPADAMVPPRRRSPAPVAPSSTASSVPASDSCSKLTSIRLRSGHGCLTPIPLTVPGQTTLIITSAHGAAGKAQAALTRIAAFFAQLRSTAE